MFATMLAVVLGALLMASPVFAADIVKHSGSVVALDTDRHTVTIEEMGSWHGPGTPLAREVYHVTTSAKIELAERTRQVVHGWRGAFNTRLLPLGQIRLGDYVTLELERENGKPVATKMTVVRPAEAAVHS